MNRREIIKLLKEKHTSFTTYIHGLTDEEFLFSYSQKWTAGQQLEHIYLAVRPVVLGMGLPKLGIRLMFGKARKPGRTYDNLVQIYQGVLANGGKASRPFIPKAVMPAQKAKLIALLNWKLNSLCTKLETLTEEELDVLRLPHPLLGKLTFREMLYFTIYHVEHHHAAAKRNLEMFA